MDEVNVSDVEPELEWLLTSNELATSLVTGTLSVSLKNKLSLAYNRLTRLISSVWKKVIQFKLTTNLKIGGLHSFS